MIALTSHHSDSVSGAGQARAGTGDQGAAGVKGVERVVTTADPVNATDARALLQWSADVAGSYKQRGGLQGSLAHRLVHGPGWAARIIVRKGRQIGWAATVRLVLTTLRARLRAVR